MKNYWEVTIGENKYTIEAKDSVVLINGERYKLSQLPHKRQAILFQETKLPIEGPDVLLAPGARAYKLIVDGRDVSTGEVYQPLEKIPGWAYVFFVLHALNVLNGAIGGMLAAMGILLTANVVTRPTWSTGKRVFVSILLLLGSGLILLLVILMLSKVMPS